MSRLLVVYESKYGQSAKIAEYIAQAARDRGHAAIAIAVRFADEVDVASQDAIVVVAPVYFSRHPKTIHRFVARRAAALSKMPSALVSVSGSASDPHEEPRAEVKRIAAGMCAKYGWMPRFIATVGGALAYPRYGFVMRAIIKSISKRKNGPTDTSRVHEATDWGEVTSVVDRILGAVPTVAPSAKASAAVPG